MRMKVSKLGIPCLLSSVAYCRKMSMQAFVAVAQAPRWECNCSRTVMICLQFSTMTSVISISSSSFADMRYCCQKCWPALMHRLATAEISFNVGGDIDSLAAHPLLRRMSAIGVAGGSMAGWRRKKRVPFHGRVQVRLSTATLRRLLIFRVGRCVKRIYTFNGVRAWT